MTLRILSLNAWGGRLFTPLMDYLRREDPDVLCLQEVVRTHEASPEWLVYRDKGVELPQRARLFDEIKALFPDHDAFFFPTASGPLFDGERAVSSEFGLATFIRRTYPVLGETAGFVHGQFSPDGWGPHPRARNAHCVRIFDYGGRFPITIAQMHGLRDTGGKEDTPERAAQAEALARMIETVWQSRERLVVCGDFNVLPGSVTFATLARLGLSDLVTGRGFADTRTSHYTKDGRFADYMLVNAAVNVLHFDVVSSPEVSDHRPLFLSVG